MKKSIIALASLIALAGVGHATDYKVGAIEVDNPWSRAVPKGASVAAGYMTIKNNGDTPDRLVGGTTPVAGKFEIHQMTMNNGVMQMRPVADGILIKPGETVALKPESFHIMMMNLKQPIEKDKPFPASLNFEKAGTVQVEFAVEGVGGSPAAATPAPETHHHH
jgi:periplasmic copper chaperone A